MKQLKVKNRKLQAFLDSIKWWQELLVIILVWSIAIALYCVTK